LSRTDGALGLMEPRRRILEGRTIVGLATIVLLTETAATVAAPTLHPNALASVPRCTRGSASRPRRR